MNDGDNALSWEARSLDALAAIKEGVRKEGYIEQLSVLWGQESSKEGGSLDFRSDNVLFFKFLGNTNMWIVDHP